MKHIIFSLLIFACAMSCSPSSSADTNEDNQNEVSNPKLDNATIEKEIKALSLQKWQWMAEKNTDELAKLFDDKSKFVHMSGTWKKDKELEIIDEGSIWYKEATVHDAAVEIFDNSVVLWNRITLVAHVRGDDVSNEFTVTEIYQKNENDWKLLNLTFSKVRDTHEIKH